MLNMIVNSINTKTDEGSHCFDTSQTSSMTLSRSVASQIHLALEALLISNNNILDDDYKEKLREAGFNLPTEGQYTKSLDDTSEIIIEYGQDAPQDEADIDIYKSIDIAETFCFKPTNVQTWTKFPFQSDTSTMNEPLLHLTLDFVGRSNLPNEIDYFIPSVVSVDFSESKDDMEARAKQHQSLFDLPPEHNCQKITVVCIIKSKKDGSFFVVVLQRIPDIYKNFTWQIAVLLLKEASNDLKENLRCFLESVVESGSLFLKKCKKVFFFDDLISEKSKYLHVAMEDLNLFKVDDDAIIMSWIALSYVRVKSMKKGKGKRSKQSLPFVRLEGIIEELGNIQGDHDLISELTGPWFWASIISGVELDLVKLSIVDKSDETRNLPLTVEQMNDVKNKISLQYTDAIANYQSKCAVMPEISCLLWDFSCLL